MTYFMQIVGRVIKTLAVWLGYLSLVVALVVAVIAINKYLIGGDSPDKVFEKPVARPLPERWESIGESVAAPFDVQIWQYGNVVTPVDGIVTIDRYFFDIKNQHTEDQVVYLNASSSSEIKNQFDSKISLTNVKVFDLGRTRIEDYFNTDGDLVLDDNGHHSLLFEGSFGGRYTGKEVSNGLTYFVKRVRSLSQQGLPTSNGFSTPGAFPLDSLYLTLVKADNVQDWSTDLPQKALGRSSVEIRFRPYKTSVYVHPECLEFLAPWSRDDTESIDCSGLDLSEVETQGDEFGVRYGEGQAIAYKHADVDLSLPLGYSLLEVGIDGGGSGLFSAIALLYKDEKKPNVYEVLIDTPSGDRCNDGNKWVSKASPWGFEFKSAATPFRLLNPDDTTDWRNWYLAKALMDEAGEELDRPAVFNEWEPYEDVTNSANACFGWIVRRFDYETGFEVIGVELETNFEPQAEDGSLEVCVDNWLLSEAGKEGLFVDKDEWDSKLGGLKQVCISDSKS